MPFVVKRHLGCVVVEQLKLDGIVGRTHRDKPTRSGCRVAIRPIPCVDAVILVTDLDITDLLLEAQGCLVKLRRSSLFVLTVSADARSE